MNALQWVVPLLLAHLLGPVPEKDTKEGNRLYQDGKLEEALQSYTQAQVDHPDAPELHYDIGNVQYRKKDTEKALEEYRTVASGKTEVARRASFNIGNVQYQAKKWKDAVEAYSAALRIDPSDLEARQNLELALQKLKEQEQKKQQQQQKKKKEGKPQSGDQGKSQKDQSQENQKPKDDHQQSQQKQQSQQNLQDQPDDSQEQKQEPSKANPAGADSENQTMTREQAEQILQALAQIEQAQQMQQQQKQKAKAKGKGKIW